MYVCGLIQLCQSYVVFLDRGKQTGAQRTRINQMIRTLTPTMATGLIEGVARLDDLIAYSTPGAITLRVLKSFTARALWPT